MAQTPTVVEHFWAVIGPLTRLPAKHVVNLGISLLIPRFDESDVKDLCDAARDVFRPQGPLLRLRPPIHIAGDIHGDLHDLLRLLAEIGDPASHPVLFLGDYIDRGGFSLEVVIVLFTLACMFPARVSLLRGNHEFPHVNHCTFLYDEVKGAYGSAALFDAIHQAFQWLPLGALVGTTHLCVHGGIGPHFEAVADLCAVPYPLADYDDPVVCECLWSDPCKTIMNYIDSTLGVGALFGQTAIAAFLAKNGLKLVVRGHQCVYGGTEMFRDMVLTVFSTSFYNDEENRGAIVHLDDAFELSVVTWQPLKPVKRQFAQFGRVPPRDASTLGSAPVLKDSDLVSLTTAIVPPIGEPGNKRKSLALVPAIVRPRLATLGL